MARWPENGTYPRRALSSNDPGQDRALASDAQKPHPVGELLPARRSRSPDQRLRRRLQSPAISRSPRQSNTRRRLLRARPHHFDRKRKDQTPDNCQPPLAAPTASCLTSQANEPETLLIQTAPCLKNSDDGQSAAIRALSKPTNWCGSKKLRTS